MKHFTFRKLYAEIDEMGMAQHSIILFGKRPHLYRSRVILKDLNPKVLDSIRAGEVVQTTETYVSQYIYNLRIDLWLVMIDLQWKGRDQDEKKKPFFDTMIPFREDVLKKGFQGNFEITGEPITLDKDSVPRVFKDFINRSKKGIDKLDV